MLDNEGGGLTYMALNRNWIPSGLNELSIARAYGFEKDYLPDLILKGYRVDRRTIKGKPVNVLQLFRDGKLVEEYPLIEGREVDIYITGRYKIASGNRKGEVVEVQIRLPIKVTYIPKKEFLDDFRNDIEKEAIKQFDRWADIEIPRLNEKMLKTVEFRERMEEKK